MVARPLAVYWGVSHGALSPYGSTRLPVFVVEVILVCLADFLVLVLALIACGLFVCRLALAYRARLCLDGCVVLCVVLSAHALAYGCPVSGSNSECCMAPRMFWWWSDRPAGTAPRTCVRGQCRGFVGAQPEGFPYGSVGTVALGVHVSGCAGMAVLESCVVMKSVLSLWWCGFGSGCGSRAPGLAWPWEVAAVAARRPACLGRPARWVGRRERRGAWSVARSMTLSF